MRDEKELEDLLFRLGDEGSCGSFGRHILLWALGRNGDDPSLTTTYYSRPRTRKELEEWYPALKG